MFPGDYLRRAGYEKQLEPITATSPTGETTEGTAERPDHESMWIDTEGKVLSYEDARKQAFGSCKCCGKPSAYPGALRCGAACNAMHEAKDCLCYAEKVDQPTG